MFPAIESQVGIIIMVQVLMSLLMVPGRQFKLDKYLARGANRNRTGTNGDTPTGTATVTSIDQNMNSVKHMVIPILIWMALLQVKELLQWQMAELI